MASWWQNSLSGIVESSNSIPTEVYNLTVENALNVVGSTTLSTTSTGALTSTSASTNTENVSSILTVGNSSTQGNIKLYGNTNSNIATIVSTQGSVGSATITLPDVTSGTDNFALVSTAQTLTNKTISGASNTLTNIAAANLTGTTLPSSIVNSSLTSVGTLSTLTVGGNTQLGTNTNGIQITLGNVSTTGSLTLVSSGTLYSSKIVPSASSTGAVQFTLPPVLASGSTNLVDDVTAQTLTNKTISGSSNTLTNIGNGSLTNSSLTVNGTSISLGGSGTVTAAAGTLTGATLNATVTGSSLTSVGTIGTGTWNGSVINPTYGGTGVNNSAFTLTLGSSTYLNQSISTYTPNIGSAGNNFTATNSGFYVAQAINSSHTMYNISIYLQWSGKGSASGNIIVSLPFTAGTSLSYFNASIGYISGITYTNQLLVFGDSGDASPPVLQLYDANKAGSTSTVLTATAFSTAGQLRLSVVICT